MSRIIDTFKQYQHTTIQGEGCHVSFLLLYCHLNHTEHNQFDYQT